MTTLIIATRNAHKVEEIRGILGAQFQFLTLRDFPDAPAVIEDAATFAGNSTKKAVELARWLSVQSSEFKVPPSSDFGATSQSSKFVLADDSGLEVDALHGAPGVHSARFAALDTGAEENSPDAENNAKLTRLLRDVPEGRRTARFRCVIALTPVLPEAVASASPVCAAEERELRTELFDGACEGRIAFVPGGVGGFGYDPLFLPEGFVQSFAELGEEVKNRISHRARALEKLRAWFEKSA
jgi:XTP/dITP diphosphohydrolase